MRVIPGKAIQTDRTFALRGGRLLVALAVITLLVAGCGGTVAVGDGNGPSGGTAASSGDGPASFLGRASNAVIFIQWTRSGSTLSGSLQQTLLNESAGSSVNTQSLSFTGTASRDGLTLQLNQSLGSTTSLVGQFDGGGFTLTYPGFGSSLISIQFVPGQLSGYNQAVSSLQTSQYASPCTLYVQGHDAQLTITGASAATDCANFVQSNSQTSWTTTSQTASSSLTAVCDLTKSTDAVTVNDDGGMAYGQQACSYFSSQGWTTQPPPTTTSTITSAASAGEHQAMTSAGASSLPALVAGSWTGIKPSSVDFSGDGGNIVTKIRWSSWTSTSAVGEGASDIQSCVPDCASGTSKEVPTSITLTNPHDGVFVQMTEVRNGTTSSYSYIGGPWPLGAS